MRPLILLLTCVAGLAAQDAAPNASLKVEEFTRNLEKAMRPSGLPAAVNLTRPRSVACAIPLLKVGPDASFKSNMPVIVPDRKETPAGEIVTPSPVCGEPEKK